jgi:MoxR-like ATPase
VTGNDIVEFQRLVRRVPVSDAVTRYAVNVARYSRPTSQMAPDFIKKWVNYGASVRAAQWMILGGKARALMHGRYHVGFDDIRALALPVLRHRILLNFHAQSERVTTDQIIAQLIKSVPTPKSGL